MPDKQVLNELVSRQIDWFRYERHVRADILSVLGRVQDSISSILVEQDLTSISRGGLSALVQRIGDLLRGGWEAWCRQTVCVL